MHGNFTTYFCIMVLSIQSFKLKLNINLINAMFAPTLRTVVFCWQVSKHLFFRQPIMTNIFKGFGYNHFCSPDNTGCAALPTAGLTYEGRQMHNNMITGGPQEMKTGIMPYQRVSGATKAYGKSKIGKMLQAIFSRNNLILLPAAFLLGRATLTGGLMPFGLPLYAATAGLGVSRMLVAAAVLLGMFSAGAREQLYIAAAAMFLFNAFNIPFKNSNSKLNFRYSVIAFLSVLIPEMVTVYLQGTLLFDVLKAILDSFIAFALVFVFRNITPVIAEGRKRYVYTSEEIICFAILVALSLSGLSNIGVLGFSLRDMASVLLVLVFSFKCGPGAGAAIGVTVGLLISMSGAMSPIVIASYAVCGMLAGILRKLGRIGSSLGFIMGNAILTIYLTGSSDMLIYFKEIAVSVGVFMLLPDKILDVLAGSFTRNLDTCPDKRSYSIRIKEITVDRLNRFSRAFRELARTFGEISETNVVTDKHDISNMFDRVADRICKDCSLCLHCWDRNFYNTYQVMFKIVEKLDTKGRIEVSDIPAYFLERCERINEFVEAVNNMYELFKVDMVWKGKVGESRELISQQLLGLSGVISNLANEIDLDVHFKGDLEECILLELNKSGIKANEVIVYENKWGKYEINVFHRSCGGRRACASSIEKLVSEITGRKMTRGDGEYCLASREGTCSLKFVEAERFRVATGIARLPKHGSDISGDSYTFMNTGDGKYIAAISDGMGTGQNAATQSRATIGLLEQFMESGFDKDITIKLINSILVLKSGDEAFATIDLLVIDLYSSEAEFVKIGAVPTFIKREDRVEMIKSASLPAGILSSIEMELVHKNLVEGDFIIMMTDGVLDSFNGGEGCEKEVRRLIQGIQSANPQEVADFILDRACENSRGKPADDMMVVAAKIWKKSG